MSMINAYQQETVTHRSITYSDLNARITVDEVISAKVVWKRRRIQSNRGETSKFTDTISDVQIYIDKGRTVNLKDMFLIGTDINFRPILDIHNKKSFIHAYGHTEVFL